MKQLTRCLCGMFLLFGLRAQDAPDWQVYDSPNHDYSIYYVEEFKQDLELAEKAIDHAHEIGFEKYEVEELHAYLRVRLYPAVGTYEGRPIRVGFSSYSYSYWSIDLPLDADSRPEFRLGDEHSLDSVILCFRTPHVPEERTGWLGRPLRGNTVAATNPLKDARRPPPRRRLVYQVSERGFSFGRTMYVAASP